MSQNALFSVSSMQHVSFVWSEMYKDSKRSKRDGYGLDGISINQFKADETASIKHLSRNIRNNTYKPQNLSPYFIPKPDGKDRVICVPAVVDRLVQRAVLNFLHSNGYGFENSISYGFVQNQSVPKAAKRAIELRSALPWVYKADITAFFDTVDRNKLLNKVRRKIRVSSLHSLLELFVRSEIHHRNISSKKRVKKMGIRSGVGLRQGMPVSPYLANIYLNKFDKEIEKLNIPMVRYADDIIAFASSEEECIRIHTICSELLAREGLQIHPIDEGKKTVIASPEEDVEFLGLGLKFKDNDYTLVVTEEQLNSIQNKVLEMSSMEYCLKNGISLSGLMRKLDDRINGYYGAYGICSNKEQLAHALNSVKSKSITRLLTDEFNIDYRGLTNKQKRFLQIE
ncbi:MAG: group II intron reverse transcriptase/maturase [Candidatus Azotimanducaceae bacterium]|jgi:group II intron reverse transcriptase/maturase